MKIGIKKKEKKKEKIRKKRKEERKEKKEKECKEKALSNHINDNIYNALPVRN